MEKHYGVIDSAGLVTMVVVWDGVQDYSPGEGLSVVALPYETDEDGTIRYTAGTGWTYNPKATKNKWVYTQPVEEEATYGGD